MNLAGGGTFYLLKKCTALTDGLDEQMAGRWEIKCPKGGCHAYKENPIPAAPKPTLGWHCPRASDAAGGIKVAGHLWSIG